MLPEHYAVVKDQVAYCGLKCSECKMGNGSVAESALNLREYLKMYEVPSWADQIGGGDIDFAQFDKYLVWATKSLVCPGCLNGGGNPECPIRLCAKGKDYSTCGECGQLRSCSEFDMLGKNAERLKDELEKTKK